jgi:hypothetical protein
VTAAGLIVSFVARRHRRIRRDSMGYLAAADPMFLKRVNAWIAGRGEVLALIRYSHAAGAKDFEFFRSADAFHARLGRLSPRACVTVFGQPQLRLRGRVDEGLIQKAMMLVPNGVEFLVVGLEPVRYGAASWHTHTAGQTHAELRDDLLQLHGEFVAVGPYPPWLEDGEDVASALIPDPDGSVAIGVY